MKRKHLARALHVITGMASQFLTNRLVTLAAKAILESDKASLRYPVGFPIDDMDDPERDDVARTLAEDVLNELFDDHLAVADILQEIGRRVGRGLS